METALMQIAVIFSAFFVMCLVGLIFVYRRRESDRAAALNARCSELIFDFQRGDHAAS
ncbi:MAG: hypothetical protein ACTFAL_16970 [Candidatus Electronema sp. V4]|uniref:hypothetical protein n=1 Tax=Candidatus Electronema sp. V4 TaxID=3454756 RepID=UPI00405539F1